MARNQQQPVPYRGQEMARGLDPYTSLHREMNRLFDDVFRGFMMPARLSQGRQGEGLMMQPDIDVCETEKEYKICADLPGVSEKDVDITLNEDVLTIKAERRQERSEDEESYHVSERTQGMFLRSLRLPHHVDADKVQAQFRDGVLEIHVPKAQEAQRSRRIQVQGSETQGKRPQQAETSRPDEASRSDQGKPGQASQPAQMQSEQRQSAGTSPGNGSQGGETTEPQASQQHH